MASVNLTIKIPSSKEEDLGFPLELVCFQLFLKYK